MAHLMDESDPSLPDVDWPLFWHGEVYLKDLLPPRVQVHVGATLAQGEPHEPSSQGPELLRESLKTLHRGLGEEALVRVIVLSGRSCDDAYQDPGFSKSSLAVTGGTAAEPHGTVIRIERSRARWALNVWSRARRKED